jgi:hypothetical protein
MIVTERGRDGSPDVVAELPGDYGGSLLLSDSRFRCDVSNAEG